MESKCLVPSTQHTRTDRFDYLQMGSRRREDSHGSIPKASVAERDGLHTQLDELVCCWTCIFTGAECSCMF